MPDTIDMFEQVYKASAGFDGVYTGKVLETLERNRKRFLVEGVVTPALPLELNGERRRGYRPGDVVVLPGHAVKPTDRSGTDYATALRSGVRECASKSQALAQAYLDALKQYFPKGEKSSVGGAA